MKILVVSGMFPAVVHGGGLRLFDILYALGEHHEVDMYSAYVEKLDRSSLEALRPRLGKIKLVTNEEFANEKRTRKDLQNWLEEIGKDDNYYDIVQVEYPHPIPLIPFLRPFGKRVGFTFMECVGKSMVIKIHDMIERNDLTEMATVIPNFWKYTLAEKFAMDNADFLIAVTDEDAAFLNKLSDAPVEIIPTCLSDHEIIEKVKECDVAVEKHTVVFLGYFGHFPNIDSVLWYLQNVHPSVLAQVPDYRFVVVGAGDTSQLQECARGDQSVSFTGRVDDIVPYLKKADVCVAPLITGAGIRGKLNQYAIAGRPIVSTTIGNKGLGYEHGKSVMIADDADAFARCVIKLLTDRGTNQALALAGKKHAEKHFTWSRHLERLEKIYRGTSI